MPYVCAGCNRNIERGICSVCVHLRPLRSETLLKGVGFWLMGVSLLMALVWLPVPVLDIVRGAAKWKDTDYWACWILVLGSGFLLLFSGRGLYRYSDAVRVIVACGSIGISFITLTTLLILATQWRKDVFDADFVLLALNSGLWGIIGSLLLGRGAFQVCRYADQYREAHPPALFYAAPWFWALAVVNGALFVHLTVVFWK